MCRDLRQIVGEQIARMTKPKGMGFQEGIHVQLPLLRLDSTGNGGSILTAGGVYSATLEGLLNYVLCIVIPDDGKFVKVAESWVP